MALLSSGSSSVGRASASQAEGREFEPRLPLHFLGSELSTPADPVPFIPILTRAGLVPAGEEASTPGMVAFPIDHDALAGHASPGLEIRRVTDAAGIDAHRQAVTAGFGSDPAVALGSACLDLLDRPECVVYVGYADGDPVVSGLGWRTGRTIGVYSIATIESARRRGYGAAMTARVVADGLVAGCDTAALQASEIGRPIYERLGFRTVVRYAGYLDPARGA